MLPEETTTEKHHINSFYPLKKGDSIFLICKSRLYSDYPFNDNVFTPLLLQKQT